jgi:hypothetical protein
MTYNPENDEITLEKVISELMKSVGDFDATWQKKHAENPVEYPLSLPVHNASLWSEFFIEFYLNGTI